jgi:hypothetical protein
MTYLKRKYFVLEIQNTDIDYFRLVNPQFETYNKLGIANIFLPSERYRPMEASFNVFCKNNTVYISVSTNELSLTNREALDYLYNLVFNYSDPL